MEKKEINDMKKVANTLKPMFNLGKSGITDTFIKTIDKYLEVHGIVKIKCLIAEDKIATKEFANEISLKTDAEIVDIKGFTFTLFR